MLYALGLVVPIFFQLVIDKVLVHESFTTLYVLAIGVAIALVFDAVFTFLRRYLLLYATNKVDIRVATRTFAHLLGLPISFFERISAGVLVKHMQQASRVREFLTGRLFLTVLDAISLFVFLPVLFLYSAKLTLLVLGFAAVIGTVIAVLVGPFRRRLYSLYQAEADTTGASRRDRARNADGQVPGHRAAAKAGLGRPLRAIGRHALSGREDISYGTVGDWVSREADECRHHRLWRSRSYSTER